jgi:CHAT domain-containing protein
LCDLELAALAQGAGASEGLDHVLACDFCGARLKFLLEIQAVAPSVEEERERLVLASSSRGWQARIAKRLATYARRSAGRPESLWKRLWQEWPRLVYTGAAAGLVLAVLGSAWWYQRVFNSPERLLASAYSQQRTVEMRFEGAKYGPLKQERGTADQSRLNRPAMLLEAEATIGRNLAAHAEAPAWLQAKARLDLLDWHYDGAIQSLKHALQIQPDSPSMLIDLASAYFERAEATDRTIDYGQVIELLGKVLAAQPDNPVALFNRAIAYERMFVFRQAIADWEHYLKVDSTGEWTPEARQKLASLQKKTDLHHAADQPVVDPAAFLLLANGPAADPRIEDYLEAAIVRWLPQAFPIDENQSDTESAHTAREALGALSSLLKSRHGDTWLSDLLQASTSPAFPAAVRHLSQSVKLNAEGDPVGAQRESRSASQLFAAIRNTPGVLRSSLETVYALDRSIAGKACLDDAQALGRDLGSRPYQWVRTQLLIERADCHAILGDLGGAKADTADALASSRSTGFGTLELRSLGIMAEQDGRRGNLLVAWTRTRSGLARYWEGAFPSMRAYQFQTGLRSIAEGRGQRYLALGLAREAAETASGTPNRAIQAMARFLLANLAASTGSTAEAEHQLVRAGQLFAELPQNSVTSSYRLRGEISLAELQSQSGDFSSPLDRLNQLRQEVEQLDSRPLGLLFFTGLGKLYWGRGSKREAEDAFREAWSLMEDGKRSLLSEEDRVLWTRQGGEAYRSLVGIRLRQGVDAEELLDLWESYRSGRQSPQAGGLKVVLPTLSSQTLISYAESTDGIVVWVANDRGVSAVWVPVPASTVERVAHQFVEHCADATTSAGILQRDGNRLYRWLIQPVEALLSPERALVIEPDGAITRIPLQALVDDSGRYLGERYSIIWSPGVWLNRSGRRLRRQAAPVRALVVGPPSLEGDTAAAFPPLPDAMDEARTVAARFRAVTFLAGKQATIEAVERDLPAAEVFHFAGHGFSNVTGSGLILADTQDRREPAVLDATRIRPAQVSKCQIAVLSACSTGTGYEDELVDPEGLAASFLRAGVPTVVAARWRIDSSATAILMGRFYEALLAGEPAERALRTAAASLRGRSETQHPYYWAAFSTFGSRGDVK